MRVCSHAMLVRYSARARGSGLPAIRRCQQAMAPAVSAVFAIAAQDDASSERALNAAPNSINARTIEAGFTDIRLGSEKSLTRQQWSTFPPGPAVDEMSA